MEITLYLFSFCARGYEPGILTLKNWISSSQDGALMETLFALQLDMFARRNIAVGKKIV